MSALALTVDQSLVDQYLARVDRFVDNVRSFEENLKTMLGWSEHTAPDIDHTAVPAYQETAVAETVQDAPEVITPDQIDMDALLAGMDFSGNGMTM